MANLMAHWKTREATSSYRKRRWPLQQKVEIHFARLAKTLLLPKAQSRAALQHLDPDGQAGVLPGDLRQHCRPKPASLKFGLHVKGMDVQMIGARLSTDAAGAFPSHLNRRKRRGLENRPKPLAPKLWIEAAKAFEIRA